MQLSSLRLRDSSLFVGVIGLPLLWAVQKKVCAQDETRSDDAWGGRKKNEKHVNWIGKQGAL